MSLRFAIVPASRLVRTQTDHSLFFRYHIESNRTTRTLHRCFWTLLCWSSPCACASTGSLTPPANTYPSALIESGRLTPARQQSSGRRNGLYSLFTIHHASYSPQQLTPTTRGTFEQSWVLHQSRMIPHTTHRSRNSLSAGQHRGPSRRIGCTPETHRGVPSNFPLSRH